MKQPFLLIGSKLESRVGLVTSLSLFPTISYFQKNRAINFTWKLPSNFPQHLQKSQFSITAMGKKVITNTNGKKNTTYSLTKSKMRKQV